MSAHTPEFQALLDRHLYFAANIHKFELIREHLIEQIHEKKSVHTQNGRHVPDDPLTLEVYTKILLFDKDEISTLDLWPCEFKHVMHVVMGCESKGCIPADYLTVFVYYNVGGVDNPNGARHNQLAAFNADDWCLDEGAAMSASDIQHIRGFMNDFLMFLEAIEEAATKFIGAAQFWDELKRITGLLSAFGEEHLAFHW